MSGKSPHNALEAHSGRIWPAREPVREHISKALQICYGVRDNPPDMTTLELIGVIERLEEGLRLLDREELLRAAHTDAELRTKGAL